MHSEFVEIQNRALKDGILEFKDQILHEIVKMREDFEVLTGYRGLIEDHEVRIKRLEKSKVSN